MKLDYATLISPYPIYLNQIGHIKSPTLKEIFSSQVTYQVYNSYLSLLMMTPLTYYEQIRPDKLEWYSLLSDDERIAFTLYKIICIDGKLQTSFTDVFNFFIVENVEWDNTNKVFWVYDERDENNQPVPVGIIHEKIFLELCNIILQRCGIGDSDFDIDPSKIKNKKSLEIYKKFKKNRPKVKSTNDGSMELPNLIASVAVESNSINFINIWELTVYQLYEQFKREQINVYFDIQKMSVAAYGNKDKTFKGNEWYKINE